MALGNTGKGSNLGVLLRIFAAGNHAFMPGPSGKLDQQGWESWTKKAQDWATSTAAIALAAWENLPSRS